MLFFLVYNFWLLVGITAKDNNNGWSTLEEFKDNTTRLITRYSKPKILKGKIRKIEERVKGVAPKVIYEADYNKQSGKITRELKDGLKTKFLYKNKELLKKIVNYPDGTKLTHQLQGEKEIILEKPNGKKFRIFVNDKNYLKVYTIN